MNVCFQLSRRTKNSGGDDFLPSDQDEEFDELDDLGEEDEEMLEDDEALDEELNFDKPHFRRLGLDYEEEDDE